MRKNVSTTRDNQKKKERNGTKVIVDKLLQMGTWDVREIFQGGTLNHLNNECMKYHFDVVETKNRKPYMRIERLYILQQ